MDVKCWYVKKCVTEEWQQGDNKNKLMREEHKICHGTTGVSATDSNIQLSGICESWR